VLSLERILAEKGSRVIWLIAGTLLSLLRLLSCLFQQPRLFSDLFYFVSVLGAFEDEVHMKQTVKHKCELQVPWDVNNHMSVSTGNL
jgi:hypothetical protein